MTATEHFVAVKGSIVLISPGLEKPG